MAHLQRNPGYTLENWMYSTSMDNHISMEEEQTGTAIDETAPRSIIS